MTTMKKMMLNWMAWMGMLMMAMTFASCDDSDSYKARTLDGTWTGHIETYYYDRWKLVGNQYRTTMHFEQRNAYGGWGYEVDYNTNSRYNDYYYCEFDWEVADGVIRIRYADSWTDTYIYDYKLRSNSFEGYMDDGSSRDIYFQLYYDGDFDWNPYWSRGRTRGETTERFYANGEFAK